MNPDDTVQASEEVEAEREEAIPARGLPSPSTADMQRNSRTRIDASASPIVVWREGNEPSAFSQ